MFRGVNNSVTVQDRELGKVSNGSLGCSDETGVFSEFLVALVLRSSDIFLQKYRKFTSFSHKIVNLAFITLKIKMLAVLLELH